MSIREMELLAWTGLPVIVLLNQLGGPDAPERLQAELDRWRTRLQGVAAVRAVLPLDAFSRCWVQELVLLREIEQVLPEARRPLMARLRAAGPPGALERLGRAFDWATSLAQVAAMVQPVEDSGALRGLVRQVGSALGLARDEETPLARAGRELLARLDGEIRSSTSDLLHLHALEGQPAPTDFSSRWAPPSISGAGGAHMRRRRSSAGWSLRRAGGLGADLASGGLTLAAA